MRTDERPVVICLTASGLEVARRAAQELDAELHGLARRVGAPRTFDDVAAHLRGLFQEGRPIVGVCAAGILIRALAPLLADKTEEPPVLALAQDGSAAVPLLGGHRGANEMAATLAEAFSAHAAITTASETALHMALETPDAGWRTRDAADDHRRLAAALLSGAGARLEGAAPAWLVDPLRAALGERLDLSGVDAAALQARLYAEGAAEPKTYAHARLALGVGAARGADPEAAVRLAERALAEAGLPELAVFGVFSLDLKADEAAVHAVARRFGVAARFFTAEALEAETPRLRTPSETVFAEVGCHGVAEAAALAAAGPQAALVLPKVKSSEATVAAALAPEPPSAKPGRLRGRLRIVGLGPGAAEERTHAAFSAVQAAEEVVGYQFYVDLLPEELRPKSLRAFALGEEEARSRYALERAAEGRDVALIGSGDAGVYAMGALVMELLDRPADRGGVSDAARRVEIVSVPGVSAMQTASARAGALLGHDFCAISLSDLLTPWEAIERRLTAAAAGDFVVALYNPVSQKRRTQFARAVEILSDHRPADTPVLIARSLGREGETLTRRTLAEVSVDEVDMMTTVLIGSSASRAFQTGDIRAGAQGWRLYTPRGYAAKSGRGENA